MINELLSRIEGEGRVEVWFDKNRIRVDFYFNEPQRFFEKILRGVSIQRGLDIVSRICGLCGTSHIYTYVKSFESEADIPSEVEDYRKTLLGIERIKSHLIHTCFLYLPDILGVDSFNELFNKYSYLVNKCLELYSNLNILNKCFEYRLHNVINMKIGGIYEYPDRDRIARSTSIIEKMKVSVNDILSILSKYIDLFSEKHFYKTLVVRGNNYPVFSSEVKYSEELISKNNYLDKLIRIEKVKSSGVRYCLYDRELFITGPLARVNTYRDCIKDIVREYLSIYSLDSVLQNIYASILARLVEVIKTLDDIENFVYKYRKPLVNSIDLKINNGVYSVFVEAPRGVLYHRYVVENNRVVDAVIVTPTQLNAYAMENIPNQLIAKGYELSIEKIKMIIRSLDPCLSCAVHVFKLG